LCLVSLAFFKMPLSGSQTAPRDRDSLRGFIYLVIIIMIACLGCLSSRLLPRYFSLFSIAPRDCTFWNLSDFNVTFKPRYHCSLGILRGLEFRSDSLPVCYKFTRHRIHPKSSRSAILARGSSAASARENLQIFSRLETASVSQKSRPSAASRGPPIAFRSFRWSLAGLK